MSQEWQEWSIDKVKPYKRNPRDNDAAVPYVAASLKEFGWQQPIVVDLDGVIVAGHTRYKAAMSLGLKTVPVHVAKDLTPEQAQAYRLTDNKTAELATWDDALLADELDGISDIDMTVFGFDEMSLDGFEHQEVTDEPIPEDVETMCKTGDIWQLGRHRLMCGDATSSDDMDRLCQGEADMVMTDPPYNVDVDSSNEVRSPNQRGIANDAWADENQFQNFLAASFVNFRDHLKAGGAWYIWHASMHTPTFRAACDDVGLQTREVLVWVKNTFAMGRQDYQWQHELCLYGWKDGAAHYFALTRSERTVQEDKARQPDPKTLTKDELVKLCERYQAERKGFHTTVQRENKPTKSALHPTMKPIPLIARLIENSSTQGEIVLDPFGGSGSTLIACEKLGRTCWTMELDPHYCDVIIRRWEDLTGQKAEKLS